MNNDTKIYPVRLIVKTCYDINVKAYDSEEAILKAKEIWLKDGHDNRLSFRYSMVDNTETNVKEVKEI